MNLDTMQAEISRHLNATNERDLVEGVHGAVAQGLSDLDPTVQLRATGAFNHSFEPDFVATWPVQSSGRHVEERLVYLRFDLRSVYASEDLSRLQGDALIVGLREGIGDRSVQPYTAELSEQAGDSLVTEASAVAQLSETTRNPISDIVRANFLRGGHGVVDRRDASELISASTEAFEAEDPAARQVGYEFLRDVSDQYFDEAAALRLRRSAQILQLAVDGASALSEEEALALGQLSQIELRTLLPYLLELPAASENLGFWRHIGSMFTFERLVELLPELPDTDLTPLVSANTDRFLAKRIRWSPERSRAEIVPTWRGHGQAVGLATPLGLIEFSVDGRRLRAPAMGDTAPSWAVFDAATSGAHLDVLTAQGAGRQWQVTSQDGSSVRDDVRGLQARTPERLFVPAATVTLPAPADQEPSVLRLDLDTGVGDAPGGADLGALATFVYGYLARRAGQDEVGSDLAGALYSE